MLLKVQNISTYNSPKSSNNFDTNNRIVSKPYFDTINFKAQPISTKQAIKFLIPAVLGSLGMIQFLPKFLFQKVYDIELEDFKYELLRLYGTNKQEEVDNHISVINQIVEKNPNKLEIMENLLRNNVFNSLGNTKYLAVDNPKLLDKQLEFLSNMIQEKEYVRHVDACHLYKKEQPFSIKDFEAKKKMLDYMRKFNRNYKLSEKWKEEKKLIDSWTIGYQQVDIINATNDLNFNLMLEMVKSKTTFIDSICSDDELSSSDLTDIGKNITEENIDNIRKLFHDSKVSRAAIRGLSKWIEDKSMSKYKKLNNNAAIPKQYIGDVGAILNDYNYDFVMSLVQNKNVPREEIANIGRYYNANSASVLKYLVKHIQDNRVKYSKEELWSIGMSINKENKEYIENLCKHTKIPLEVIDNVASIVNSNNYNVILLLGQNTYNHVNEVRECAVQVTKKNKKFVEVLCSEYKIKAEELVKIMNNLYCLEKMPIEDIDLTTKIEILNFHTKYGELMKEMKEYKLDYEKKIKAVADSVQTNIESKKSENLKEFLFKILANNNSETENLLKTYDFTQFGKDGIPLSYSRKDFVENLEENILSEIKAEDRRTILNHFGIIDNDDYDGLWNINDIDKSKLISENGKRAYYKTKTELSKFMLQNEVVSNDNQFNQIINGLIKGLPPFVPLIGKIQHGTHDYSVDIHTLKVLQSCLNNPLYEELSDEGKTILKISAILHDIGKNGKVCDPEHAQKSADYTNSILDNINISNDIKTRIIDVISNHHWFAGYNEESLTPQNIAIKCRTKEDFLIYKILAKADLKNVSDSFHLGVTGTKNEKEYNEYFDKKMKPIQNKLEKISLNSNLIFHTKILNNGDKFPIEEIKLHNGEKVKVKVLHLNNLPKETMLEQYGFPRGTTVENARFLVHMTKTGTNFDVANALIKSHKTSSSWSTSLISIDNNETYNDMLYGFIFDVGLENIAEAYYKNTGSGYHKDMKVFEDMIFDFNNKERDYISKNFKKELIKNGIWLSDKDYIALVDYLKKKKHITAIKNDIRLGKKTIKAKTIVKCLEKTRDSLFYKNDIYGHNEIVVLNPKIQGLIVKYNSIDACNDDFLMFASKHNLPIIVMG